MGYWSWRSCWGDDGKWRGQGRSDCSSSVHPLTHRILRFFTNSNLLPFSKFLLRSDKDWNTSSDGVIECARLELLRSAVRVEAARGRNLRVLVSPNQLVTVVLSVILVSCRSALTVDSGKSDALLWREPDVLGKGKLVDFIVCNGANSLPIFLSRTNESSVVFIWDSSPWCLKVRTVLMSTAEEFLWRICEEKVVLSKPFSRCFIFVLCFFCEVGVAVKIPKKATILVKVEVVRFQDWNRRTVGRHSQILQVTVLLLTQVQFVIQLTIPIVLIQAWFARQETREKFLTITFRSLFSHCSGQQSSRFDRTQAARWWTERQESSRRSRQSCHWRQQWFSGVIQVTQPLFAVPAKLLKWELCAEVILGGVA